MSSKITRIFFVMLFISLVGLSFGKYNGGTGEPNDPYLIATPNDLNSIGLDPNDWDKHFLMTADINMAGYTYTTALIAPDMNWSSGFQGSAFTGTFDGNDHTIFSLIIDYNGAFTGYLGMFGQINEGGDIKNLRVEDVNVAGIHPENNPDYLGGLCGNNYFGTISNCHVTGSVTGGYQAYHFGGLCGYNEGGILTGCYVSVTVNGYRDVGGLCGHNKGSIIDCHAEVNIPGDSFTNYVGGICGYNDEGTISNCSAKGSITGNYSLGGLCGYNQNGDINDCNAASSVQGYDNLGGLCGNNGGTISNCYSTGSVTGINDNLGGLCGKNGGTISGCYATGSVTGIYNSDNLGGLCGNNYSNGSIVNCYATGPVTGGDYSDNIGGLSGNNINYLINCYSSGSVIGGIYSNHFGGLCGNNGVTAPNNCYFLDTAGPDNGIGTPLMDTQMKQQSSFAGWDFSAPIWRICDGVSYPRLAWEPDECCYCAASGGGDVYIRDVKIGSISNTGTDSNGYTDYTSMQTSLDTGLTYPTFVNISFADHLIPNECRIYIDWNQDCDFDDPNEEIVPELLPYSATAYFVEITPPADAVTGETGMRVRVTGGSLPNPCGSTFQGEVEDYTIIITDEGACGQTQFGGGCGTPNEPYLIYTPEHLRAVGNSNWTWGRHFELAEDIDLGECCPNNFSIIGDGYVVYFPFEPPTEVGVLFTGVFDGNGHTISNAHYEDNDGTAIGLFGTVGPDAEIRDLILSNPHIEINTTDKVGALAGELFQGDVFRCQVRDASIQGDNLVGGLVGYSYGGLIAGCYATGTVSGNEAVGGLVGQITASVSNCWTNNQVTGSQSVGGLIGVIDSGSVSRCYAAGPVSGTSDCGGLIGAGSGNIGLSFWDVNSTGQSSSAGGIPKTTAEMYMRITFTDAGWDFVEESANGTFDIWDICEGTNYPKFSWQVPIEGDLVCPDGVDFIDYSVLANQWHLEKLEQDYNSDGRVNFTDWATFANNWDGNYTELSSFLACWLARSASQADIAPAGGDDVVDWQDLAILTKHWLEDM